MWRELSCIICMTVVCHQQNLCRPALKLRATSYFLTSAQPQHNFGEVENENVAKKSLLKYLFADKANKCFTTHLRPTKLL